MLVLSRQRNEQIVIMVPPSTTPTQIILQVTDIHGDKVRIGIDAPRAVVVNRREVHEAIRREEQGKPLSV